MPKLKFFCLSSRWSSLFFMLHILVSAQVTFRISPPNNTPLLDTLFLAGNFNNWTENDPDYALIRQPDFSYTFTFRPGAGVLQFKFTRGSWTTVETTSSGGFQPDRTLSYDGSPQTVNIRIGGWQDIPVSVRSTAAENVYWLDDNMYMPALNKNRRVLVYLPPDYFTSDKKYPVLYLHDAQNVFDATTSFSGEWEVDETLNQLSEKGDYGVIAVAIDNGGADRINELTPWPNPEYGGGQASKYVDFIVHTLKPAIDLNFRTLADRQNTGIMGSSLGGLTSNFAIFAHQNVFGKAGVFSPSFWFSENAFSQVEETGKKQPLRIYLMGGQNEGGDMFNLLMRMKNTLNEAGFVEGLEHTLVTPADGQHSEWFWAREFGAAYKWLFGNEPVTSGASDPSSKPTIVVGPNPASESIFISGLNISNNTRVIVSNIDGKYLWERKLDAPNLEVNSLRPGTYLFSFYENQIQIETVKIVIQ